MKRMLAISDIHGELELFNKLLEKVEYDASEDQLILLGDYVDRGPDSKGVVDRVMELKKQGAIVLRGNHDEMMISAIDGSDFDRERWYRNGALPTLQSYDPSINDMDIPDTDLFLEHVDFIKNLDYYYETEDYIFVHAGVQPGVDRKETDSDKFVWIREEFYEHYNEDKVVIFGHTPTALLQGKGKHEVYFGNNNIIGIDGAATYGGQLNCLELPSKKTDDVRKT
jgi:serine/threonine protein phosphatase 1